MNLDIIKNTILTDFTTNRDNPADFDEALLRPGRCFGFFPFPKLTAAQAIVARKVHGLPDFEVTPEKSMCLAEALRAPTKKVFIDNSSGRYFVK